MYQSTGKPTLYPMGALSITYGLHPNGLTDTLEMYRFKYVLGGIAVSVSKTRTGIVWGLPARARSQRVRRVCEYLEKYYRPARLGNPSDPTDVLVYIILSNKTAPKIAMSTYKNLKASLPEWDHACNGHHRAIAELLHSSGLASKRSTYIVNALRRIRADFGSCDLNHAGEMDDSDLEVYLSSLPGVSAKVAKCVMLFGFERSVLPVDTHVFRIAKRLGWVDRNRADQCHVELESLVPSWRRYSFHVNCISHGRTTCRPAHPFCQTCCIRSYCCYLEEAIAPS